jgi:TetR/AcrR family transcriptional regulator, cholesterol catabolism regulator
MSLPSINRKQQILNVTAKQFRTKGYAASSMRELASELGIEAASLYHHISSKDELLDTICFGMVEKFISALKEVNDIYFNAEEKLRMAINLHVNLMTANLDQSVVCLNEWRNLKEPRLSEYKNLRAQYENEFKSIIVLGKNEDIFDNVNLDFATLTILSSVNWIYQWYDPKGGITPEEIATNLSDFILGGLRKKLITDIY